MSYLLDPCNPWVVFRVLCWFLGICPATFLRSGWRNACSHWSVAPNVRGIEDWWSIWIEDLHVRRIGDWWHVMVNSVDHFSSALKKNKTLSLTIWLTFRETTESLSSSYLNEHVGRWSFAWNYPHVDYRGNCDMKHCGWFLLEGNESIDPACSPHASYHVTYRLVYTVVDVYSPWYPLFWILCAPTRRCCRHWDSFSLPAKVLDTT